jgi:hypothetical protein
MNNLIQRYATPLTVGLFAISTVSGVALFFHWQSALFHQMHEWLSILLLLPFALHVWKNWSYLVAYLRRGTLVLPVTAMILIAVPFAWPVLTGRTSAGSGPPGARAVTLMTKASLTTLAPILKRTPDDLSAMLAARGYLVRSLNDTPETIAAASGATATKVLTDAFPAR